jgi:glycosyltransferase involved in cell wall biosynthesis
VKILLLSAYAARSHVHWHNALQAMFPDWQWQVLTLPPRHFSWRIRGNPLYWAMEQRPLLESGYDLLLATSMVDLATLRGLVPALAELPSLLYFHENQFEYPPGDARHSPVEAQMVSLYSALAANRLGFNSAYNRDTFLAGCDVLLRRLPDRVPAGVVALLRARAVVLPVPFDGAEDGSASEQATWAAEDDYPRRPLRLLWLGRFEHDKGAERLEPLLQRLEQLQLDFELALVGQQFRRSPEVFSRLRQQHRERLVLFGNLPTKGDLHTVMRRADLVLSTALHEFQGLAVLEAVSRGCSPVVPDRLAYREIYPDRFRYCSALQEPSREAASAAALIQSLAAQLAAGQLPVPAVDDWAAAALGPRYRAVFAELCQSLPRD